MKHPKNYSDVSYHQFYKNRKGEWKTRKIAGSTVADSVFLAAICEQYPDKTIAQLRDILMDRSKYIRNYDAIRVLDAHIAKGLGDDVPGWKDPIDPFRSHGLDDETDTEYFARKRREKREVREHRKKGEQHDE